MQKRPCQLSNSRLIQSYNEKSDELRRAMDDLEQMNSENADYLQKIEDHENTIDTLRQEADEYEELARSKYSSTSYTGELLILKR